MAPVSVCPVCGASDFLQHQVLWPELISDWQLSVDEAEYIDRQQGFCCSRCGNNLRAMALADAILAGYALQGSLLDAIGSGRLDSLSILEINEAGNLTPILRQLPGHRLVCYPDYDMTRLALDADSFDLVIHSDTLEHVPNPVAGLAECRRVLKSGGRCVFTVPIVTARMSRDRGGLKKSYHGSPAEGSSALEVQTEFGADVWLYVLRAGFSNATIHALELPAGLALNATK